MRRAAVLVLTLVSALAPGVAAGRIQVETFAGDLDFPTNLAFSPDGRVFFTEKNTGNVRVIRDGRLLPRPLVTVPVTNVAEAGLLGLALHPRFPEEPWVYLYYSRGDRNVLVRVRVEGNRGTDEELLLEGLAVSAYHNGGDIAFGPDGKLYAAIGEAHDANLAQEPTGIGGKVVRLEDDGSVPEDNPFRGSPVYSLGHRNSFGLCFDPRTGNLWETENGPSEHDEVNLILAGRNYGWPVASGASGDDRFEDPALDFPEVIVPTGCAFYEERFLRSESRGALFFGDYGGRLHRAILDPARERVVDEAVFLDGLGAITDVQAGPDGRLYVVTTESILRLPADLPAPRRTGEPQETPVTIPPVTGDAEPERDPPWLAIASTALTAAALLVALAARRRADRRSPR